MDEEFINYLWQYQLINQMPETSDGEKLKVIHPGNRNTDSGPDFFNARIKIGETTWAGNVEVHVQASDWNRHNHQHDPAFDNVILHVVLKNDQDIFRKNREKIPTLELEGKFNKEILKKYHLFMTSKKWIPCEDLIPNVDYFELTGFFEALMAERLEQKSAIIEEKLARTKLDFNEVFYQKLARNFGFNTNSDAFEWLAGSLPVNVLAKHKDNLMQVEAILYGQAGLLNKKFKDDYPNKLKSEYLFLAEKYKLEPLDEKIWKFMRLRPANFPTIRIAQFAKLFYNTSSGLTALLEAGKLDDLIHFFKTGTSNYWNNHYRFDTLSEARKKKLGTASIQLILINTIIPFLFIYGRYKADESMQQRALDWLEKLKPENNHIVKKFRTLGITPNSAMHSQAMLQLKQHYCDRKRCLECRIGHQLLGKS